MLLLPILSLATTLFPLLSNIHPHYFSNIINNCLKIFFSISIAEKNIQLSGSIEGLLLKNLIRFSFFYIHYEMRCN